jgi:hypothetical protein
VSYQKKDGDIVLFQNDKTKDTQPTMRGELWLDNVTYEVAVWTKLDRNGKKFLAGNAKVKEERPAKVVAPASKPVEETPAFDDEIPF